MVPGGTTPLSGPEGVACKVMVLEGVACKVIVLGGAACKVSVVGGPGLFTPLVTAVGKATVLPACVTPTACAARVTVPVTEGSTMRGPGNMPPVGGPVITLLGAGAITIDVGVGCKLTFAVLASAMAVLFEGRLGVTTLVLISGGTTVAGAELERDIGTTLDCWLYSVFTTWEVTGLANPSAGRPACPTCELDAWLPFVFSTSSLPSPTFSWDDWTASILAGTSTFAFASIDSMPLIACNDTPPGPTTPDPPSVTA